MQQAVSEKSIHILMVEDCKTDVLLFRHLLGPVQQHCTITDVPRMIDAFKQIDAKLFDVILLDLNLIDIDGMANVAAIRAECPFTPVVIYSGRNDEKLQKEARMVGAAGYIVKGETSAAQVQETIAMAMAAA